MGTNAEADFTNVRVMHPTTMSCGRGLNMVCEYVFSRMTLDLFRRLDDLCIDSEVKVSCSVVILSCMLRKM